MVDLLLFNCTEKEKSIISRMAQFLLGVVLFFIYLKLGFLE